MIEVQGEAKKKGIFSLALGAVLAELDSLKKLSIAFVPSGWGLEVAREIVEAVNAKTNHEGGHPFCIHVRSNPEKLGAVNANEMTLSDSLKYRQGSRLVLVSDESATIASVDGSFSVVLSASYPESAKVEVGLRPLAKFALQEIMIDLDLKHLVEGISEKSVQRLESCFNALEECHRIMGQADSGDWNDTWQTHVSAGLENLRAVLLSKKTAEGSAQTLEELLSKYTYASFGLPRPTDGQTISASGNPASGRALSDAIDSYWHSEDSISGSIAYLNKWPEWDGSGHPISTLNLSVFEQGQIGTGSALLGWMFLASESMGALEALCQLREVEFLNPIPAALSGKKLTLSYTSGLSLKLTAARSSTNLSKLESLTLESFQTPEIIVTIPASQEILPEKIQASNLKVKSRDSRAEWFGSLELLPDGNLGARGHLSWTKGAIQDDSMVKPIVLGLAFELDDSLAGVVDRQSTAELFLVPATSSGVAVWKVAKTFKGLDQMGPTSDDGSEPARSSTELPENGIRILVIAWGEGPAVEGQVMSPIPHLAGVAAQELIASASLEVSTGGSAYTIYCPGKHSAVHSPILAAILKAPLTGDDLDEPSARSIRGMLERLMVDQLESAEFRSTNFHFALPEVPIGALGNLGLIRGLSVGAGASSAFDKSTNFRVLDEFSSSPSVQDFMNAFDKLEVLTRLKDRVGPLSVAFDIPSRVSFKDLWSENKSDLDGYLSAYTTMVAEAKKSNDPDTIFWATYPFSFSIWDLEQDGQCKAVLLSPLHPLRLGWISAAEETLSQVEDASLLAGAIEGWNLPLVGPGTTLKSSMIAVPMDNGAGQLFLGWSMLLKASSGVPVSLAPPIRIAGFSAPGSASGGMNSSSTNAALNSYRRINPHVSTLTIDLASSMPATRLVEIDDAILARSREWSKDGTSELLGGVRVWDSTNREGEPPLQLAQKVFGEIASTPFTWKRYRPGQKSGIRSNVRLLQDSGVKLSVIESSESKNMGLLAETPLRRFEAFTAEGGDKRYSQNSPSLDPTFHDDPYALALIECERFGSGFSIRAELHKGALVDERADWTVSGEAMVSPAGLASMLGAGESAQQMLWEWRPPIFDSQQGDLVQRRPFLAVARVPSSFKGQLSQILGKAKGSEPNDGDVEKLLTKLGGRGVGLSALLSMGGTHTTGALGFYLALSLVDSINDHVGDTFVLPIDACEPFIKLLAGDKEENQASKRRADLMILRLSDNSLTLTPLEIKLYGLAKENPSSKLPAAGDKALGEALEQAISTWHLLCKVVVAQKAALESGPEATMVWHNSLAAMVEAAAKMRPTSKDTSKKLHFRLKRLLSGRIAVTVGSPLITYFGHAAKTASGAEFEVSQNARGQAPSKAAPPVGLLSCNLSASYSAVGEATSNSSIIHKWRELFDWSQPTEVAPSPKPITSSSEQASGGLVNVDDAEVIDESTSGKSAKSTEVRSYEGGLTGGEIISSTSKIVEPESINTAIIEPEIPAAVDASPPIAAVIGDPIKGDGVKVQVGTLLNSLNNAPVSFWPANTALNQMNVGVVGDLGTGKTQFLKGLIHGLRKETSVKQPGKALSFLIFDYKNDYADKEFVDSVGAHVLKPKKIPLSIFPSYDGYSEDDAFEKSKSFAAVLSKIYPGVGPVQIENLTMAIENVYVSKNGKAPFLSEILNAYKTIISGKADSVSSILRDFVGLKIFSEDETELMSFEELIGDKVLVVALNELGADARTQNSVVVMFLDFYYEYMLKTEKSKYVGVPPNKLRTLSSFLLVDEATNILEYELDVLMKILLQGREFGFGAILASQYLSHFKTAHENYGEPLLTWVIHKVPFVKLAEIKTLGIPEVSQDVVDKIAHLEVHQALYSSLGVGGAIIRGTPFFEIIKEAGAEDLA
jgi:DNA phosphorothioation-dependent restriction protein DptH